MQFENNVDILQRLGLEWAKKNRECALEVRDRVSSKTLNGFKSLGFKNIKVECFWQQLWNGGKIRTIPLSTGKVTLKSYILRSRNHLGF